MRTVKRVYLPKVNVKFRLIGVSSCEDRLVQDVLAKVLNGVYEPRFIDFSYGFRPDRSVLDAIKEIRNVKYRRLIDWVLVV